MKIIVSCIFLFILCSSLISYTYEGALGNDKDIADGKNSNSISPTSTLSTALCYGNFIDGGGDFVPVGNDSVEENKNFTSILNNSDKNNKNKDSVHLDDVFIDENEDFDPVLNFSVDENEDSVSSEDISVDESEDSDFDLEDLDSVEDDFNLENEKNFNLVTQIHTLNIDFGDNNNDLEEDLEDDWDEEDNDLNDFDNDWDEEDGDSDDFDDDSEEENEEIHNYYQWEWNGTTYFIDLNEFNLTDEELTELFTKWDNLREEIVNLESIIEKMELFRNEDILLAIDELYENINKITNNTEFNDLLLSLKNINIIESNSTFNDLKMILESIKEEYPDENFSEIDLLMDNLETLLNEELEIYENLTLELKEKLAELTELYEKYPFLNSEENYLAPIASVFAFSDSAFEKNQKENQINNAHATMKETCIPFLFILLILLSVFGFSFYKKQ